MKKIIPIIICILIASIAAQGGYRWPVNGKPRVTSTYAEYRGIRAHHGLDMSTFARRGVPIRSISSGYVSSIMYQHWGIGYAVFVKHGRNIKTFYGHLNGFHNRILKHRKTKKIRWRIKNKRDFRIYFASGDIPVRKGSVIGYSGDTGRGPIHLHFEYRKNNISINPLVYAFKIKDYSAPRFVRFYIVPLNPYSHVNYRTRTASYRTKYIGRKRYRLRSKRIPIIAGRIGLMAKVYDKAGYRNSVAIYKMKLYINNKLKYNFALNSIPRKKSHHIGLYYNRARSSLRRFTYYLYSRKTKQGSINTSTPGKIFKIKIECFDANGNKSTFYSNLKAGKKFQTPAYYYKPNIFPNKSVTFISNDEKCRLHFSKKSAMYKEMISFIKEPPFYSGTRGISVLSNVYAVGPSDLLLDEPLKVSIKYTGNDYQKVGIYAMDKHGSYYFHNNYYNKRKKAFITTSLTTQAFFLARDTARPTIRFRKHRRYIRRYRPIKFFIQDIGTGVNFNRINVRIDGKKVLWSFNIDKHYFYIFRHNPIWQRGRHTLTIQAADVAGNLSRKKTYYYYVR